MPEDGNIETDLKNASNLLVSPETSDMPSGGNLPQGVGKSAAVIAGTSNNSSDQSVIKLPSGSGKVLKYILADHSGFFTAAEGLEVVRENAAADCKELYQLLLGKNLKELEPYSLTAPNLTSVFISAVNPPKSMGTPSEIFRKRWTEDSMSSFRRKVSLCTRMPGGKSRTPRSSTS